MTTALDVCRDIMPIVGFAIGVLLRDYTDRRKKEESSLERHQKAVDAVLQFIETAERQDQSDVDALAVEYIEAVTKGRQIEAVNLAQRFACKFCVCVGATIALRAIRGDEQVLDEAVKLARKRLNLPDWVP